MALTTPQKRYSVAVLLFNGVDVLDFAGPIEVFSHVSVNKNPDNPDRVYKITTVGKTATIRAANSLTVSSDLLIEDASRELEQFDLLVVPGGPPSIIMPLLSPESPEMQLVRSFSKLAPRGPDNEPRIIFSVCTGAFFLGAAGLLGGLQVTTHHRALEPLRQLCIEAGTEPASIVEKRFVDSGVGKAGPVGVFMSGGISSGLDAVLHLVEKQTSRDMAEFITRIMEYKWRGED